MDIQNKKRLIKFPLKHNLNPCPFCGYQLWNGECDNCLRQNNQVWKRQLLMMKRQPHAVDERQVEKQ